MKYKKIIAEILIPADVPGETIDEMRSEAEWNLEPLISDHPEAKIVVK